MRAYALLKHVITLACQSDEKRGCSLSKCWTSQ